MKKRDSFKPMLLVSSARAWRGKRLASRCEMLKGTICTLLFVFFSSECKQ